MRFQQNFDKFPVRKWDGKNRNRYAVPTQTAKTDEYDDITKNSNVTLSNWVRNQAENLRKKYGPSIYESRKQVSKQESK